MEPRAARGANDQAADRSLDAAGARTQGQAKAGAAAPRGGPAPAQPDAAETTAPAPAPAPETGATGAPRPDPAAEQRRQEAERQQAEQRRLEAERQARLQALNQTQFLDALQNEAEALEQAADTADSEQVAQSYRQRIYETVVANWSRPPSARNGMEASLLVELVPTGDIVNVTLVRSSGNTAFDRSAESAVRKARRFDVPKESEIFERYFRRFTLLFRPEDLLR
ncbi:MAG: cell envelope integrity protein TolA [Pseudomonadales bacterium]